MTPTYHKTNPLITKKTINNYWSSSEEESSEDEIEYIPKLDKYGNFIHHYDDSRKIRCHN